MSNTQATVEDLIDELTDVLEKGTFPLQAANRL